MPTIKLTVEYDGSGFSGWQVQPGHRTIQGELQRVLEQILRENIPVITASGRTDAGVHARAQAVCFKCEQIPDFYKLINSVSNILKGELSILKAEIVADDFHPTFHVKEKQYSYHILHRQAPPVHDRGKVWHVSSKLDIERMRKEAKSLEGIHDFTSLRAGDCQGKTPVKEILKSEITLDGEYVIYTVVGKGFLKQMVRIIVGTLVQIGRGWFGEQTLLEIIDLKDRRKAGVTAPPHGLFLDWVKYD